MPELLLDETPMRLLPDEILELELDAADDVPDVLLAEVPPVGVPAVIGPDEDNDVVEEPEAELVIEELLLTGTTRIPTMLSPGTYACG